MATIEMTAYEYATRTGQTIETALTELHEFDRAGALVAKKSTQRAGVALYDVDTTIVPDNDGTFLA